MHYHAEIWVPDGEEPGTYVAKVMKPHREEYDEASDGFSGFWDWFQIGGRWTGEHAPGYDPEKDERNIEPCIHCGGTGFRTDEIGKKARDTDPTYTCNGCGQFNDDTKAWGHGPSGPGKTAKWPTQWARFDGDIMPVADVSDELTCYTLIIQDKVLHQKEWDGEEFHKTDFDGRVKPALAALEVQGGVLVTVDYHS